MLMSRFVFPNRGTLGAVSRSSSMYCGPGDDRLPQERHPLFVRPGEFAAVLRPPAGDDDGLGDALQHLADVGLFEEMIEAQLDQVALAGRIEQIRLGQFPRYGSDGDAQHERLPTE